MNDKSDEEIQKILSFRHGYKPEAVEAATKIAMSRNLVDNELNEISPFEINGVPQNEVMLNTFIPKKYNE